jgi:hypothetical protein
MSVLEQCLPVQQSSISSHPVCCSVFQIKENVLHIDNDTDFVSYRIVYGCYRLLAFVVTVLIDPEIVRLHVRIIRSATYREFARI